MNTADLRRRVTTKMRGRSTPSGFPERIVLTEVPVDTAETYAERHGLDPAAPLNWDASPEAEARWRARLSRPAGVRRVDVVAVGLWRSTCHQVHGIELKVSRADWLNEVRHPEKAAAGMAACDFWWLAVGDRAIVKDGELPDGWGLLVPSGRGMRAVTAPTQRLEPVRSPAWLASVVARAATQHSLCRGMGYVDGYWDGIRHGRHGR